MKLILVLSRLGKTKMNALYYIFKIFLVYFHSPALFTFSVLCHTFFLFPFFLSRVVIIFSAISFSYFSLLSFLLIFSPFLLPPLSPYPSFLRISLLFLLLLPSFLIFPTLSFSLIKFLFFLNYIFSFFFFFSYFPSFFYFRRDFLFYLLT